ncbi:MAG: hypothetical protein GY822_20975 [Deltaproteobacteria bacterium]|nr:hypothetical protein [Deltaproteobacteria bacterium]
MSPIMILVLSSTLLTAGLNDNVEFNQGKALYQELEFEQALFRFQKASVDSSLSAEERASSMMWTAMCYAGVGNEVSAKRTLSDAVSVFPQVVLPKVASPRLKGWVAEAKKTAAGASAAKTKAEKEAKAKPKTPASTSPAASNPNGGAQDATSTAATPSTSSNTAAAPSEASTTSPHIAEPESSVWQTATEMPPEDSGVGPFLLMSGAGVTTVGIVAGFVTVGFLAHDVLNVQPRILEYGAIENPSSGEAAFLAQNEQDHDDNKLIILVSGVSGGVIALVGLGVLGSSLFFE